MTTENFDFKKRFELVKENKGLFATAILVIGALPIFVYDLSVGDLPDFTVSDMTGALISSFLVGTFLSLVMIGYLLLAGLATRKAVTGFYSNDKEGFDKNAPYLFRGKFIVGVTLLDVILWTGYIFRPFSNWFAPTNRGSAGIAYHVALWSCVALVLFDWRKRGRVVKYLLSGALGGAIAFLAVLLFAYWAGFVDSSARVIGSAPQHEVVVPTPSAFLALLERRSRDLLSGETIITTAVCASIAAALITIAVGLSTRKRRQAVLAGQTPGLLSKHEAVRLVIAKVIAAAVFWFVSMIGVLFFLIIVDASPGATQAYVAFLGASLVFMLNWAAFAASGWKARAWLALATFAVVFVFLPLQSRNALMLPKMVVNVLGFGNRHASTVSLSGASCALLVPYGADCKGTKDAEINVMNVNILERLGSNVMLELLVKREDPVASAKYKRDRSDPRGRVVSTGTGKVMDQAGEILWLPQLKPDSNNQISVALPSGCDALLLDKLSGKDQARSKQLVCVKISVPKAAVVGRTVDGIATYNGAFTSYLKVPS
ncbi:hypothetical protein [Paraburkholderia terrae]|uniref:hypothetical protein n=1 Tax=Paraburkholderia terrae TaxID=311230 RepID=UPI001EE34017|nr:hypothetical protein [Paraburkholderia terrae]GJH05661.1 hypothetical protein CBA19C8_33910 [Paraburkholderia terrae]